jgi:hypothetical protein
MRKLKTNKGATLTITKCIRGQHINIFADEVVMYEVIYPDGTPSLLTKEGIRNCIKYN